MERIVRSKGDMQQRRELIHNKRDALHVTCEHMMMTVIITMKIMMTMMITVKMVLSLHEIYESLLSTFLIITAP